MLNSHGVFAKKQRWQLRREIEKGQKNGTYRKQRQAFYRVVRRTATAKDRYPRERIFLLLRRRQER